MVAWPNCQSDTAVQLDREAAHSASFCASSNIFLSGLRLSERGAPEVSGVDTVAGVGQFHYIRGVYKGYGHSAISGRLANEK